MLFIGIDYEINQKGDVYFTTMYKHLDSALRANVSKIHFGQDSDDFKMRLGCVQEARHVYIKGCGVLGPSLRLFSNSFLGNVTLMPPQNVWRKDR
jgi:hypothetical protein